jgi:class 3 adenylate cyclase
MLSEFTPPGLRGGLRWLNRRRSLVALVQAAREVLPGDSGFGDPMSTAGTSAAHALGRRAWTLQDGRFSLLGELALAGLQVADWLGEDIRGVASGEEQSILFVDLRGFSRWALSAGYRDVADLLRNADAVITEAVESREGVVVKRLGDGAMAIFADCEPAVDAAFEAISGVRRINIGSYRPVLRTSGGRSASGATTSASTSTSPPVCARPRRREAFWSRARCVSASPTDSAPNPRRTTGCEASRTTSPCTASPGDRGLIPVSATPREPRAATDLIRPPRRRQAAGRRSCPTGGAPV